MSIKGSLVGVGSVTGRMSRDGHVSGHTSLPKVVPPDPYTGSYEITPTQETQILETDHLYMTGNVTINPIPSNYGKIEWNGSYLKVT